MKQKFYSFAIIKNHYRCVPFVVSTNKKQAEIRADRMAGLNNDAYIKGIIEGLEAFKAWAIEGDYEIDFNNRLLKYKGEIK